MRLACYVSFLALAFLGTVVHASEVTVAVASNFSAPMKEIVAAFEKESGHKAKLAFGSSGKFYAQIRNGAPFDLFFSADQAKPKALEREGMTVAGSRLTYAVGALALWSADNKLVDKEGRILKQGTFRKLAVANPKLAPYGAAAMEVLESLKLAEALQAKLVMGENISQTFQFVSSGNAEIGFVALSQALQGGTGEPGSYWIVPSALYEPILQDAVILKRGKGNEAAAALLRFMRTEQTRNILASFGYGIAAEG